MPRPFPLLRPVHWLLMLVAVLCALPASAQTFPALSGRVVDAANIIPDDREAALAAKLAATEQASGRQFVVATIPSLEGYPIEDYGYRLGRAWGIGEKGANTGLLLIIAPNDRKVRIEVGYGLEPIMTDALSSVIINRQILPAFKAGDMPAGIDAGADAIIAQLKLSPEEAAARAKKLTAEPETQIDIGTIIFLAFFFLFFILPLFRRGRRGVRYGNGPVVIWSGGSGWGGGSGGSSWGDGGGFSGGGGSFGGGGASGGW